MSHRILITGASGYLGGTLLARLATADLPAYDKLYALVRTDEQAEAVARYGAAPLAFDIADEAAAYKAIVDNNITIVFYLIHARRAEHEVFLIKALAEVGRRTGSVVHFLHVGRPRRRQQGARTDMALTLCRRAGQRSSRATPGRRRTGRSSTTTLRSWTCRSRRSRGFQSRSRFVAGPCAVGHMWSSD